MNLLQFLLILSVACIHLHNQVGRAALTTSSPPAQTSLRVLTLFAALAALLWLSQVVCARFMDRGRRNAWGSAHFALSASRVLGLALLYWTTFFLGWADAVRAFLGDPILVDEVVACLPFWLLVAFGWWAHEPVERRIREAALTREIDQGVALRPIESRLAYTWSNVRQQALVWLVPVLALATWSEAVDHAAANVGLDTGSASIETFRLVGSLAVFVLAPVAIRRAWKTVELGPGELRDRITAVSRFHNVRAAGPYVWSTPGDGINAAVVGFLHPFRYLLISRSMLETFSEGSLIAVVAHEVAHLKLRHMMWLGLAVLATVGLSGWGLTALDYTVPVLRPWLNEATAAAATLVAVVVVFGFVSRRFEWQADAFAVRHVAKTSTDGPAISSAAWGALTGALAQVAASDNMSMRRWGWRHGSLADRCRRVRLLNGRDVDSRFPIDVHAAIIKLVTVVVILGSYLPLIWLSLSEHS